MMPQVLEGQWEDIRAHDAELIGRRVRLILLTPEDTTLISPPQPNQAVLDALRQAEKIQQDLQPQSSSTGLDSVALVRLARSGAMYGDYSNGKPDADSE